MSTSQPEIIHDEHFDEMTMEILRQNGRILEANLELLKVLTTPIVYWREEKGDKPR